MRPTKAVLPALLAIGVFAGVPAAASAHTSPSHAEKIRAHVAGGGVAPTLPSIVRVRVTRAEKALETAGKYVDHDESDKAVASLLNVRRNMYAAWRGATYVIEHAPPPPAESGRVHRRAHASGTGGAGTTYADPPTTAVAVLGLQHDVATSAFGLLDGAKGALRNAVSTTMFAALDRRDQAIDYIHQHTPPPPAEEGRVHPKAKASGAPVAGDFNTLMPGIVPDLDDEIQQTNGLIAGGALTPGEKKILGQANAQVVKTENTVNTFWPPLPAEG